MSNISVVIPTWNRANTIEKAVLSALNQTIPPVEVLVCDDGSTDNTYEVIRLINDPRVKWINGPRGGRPAIPRNRGIRESKGEWLAFLDSDDEWLPEKLEKQLAHANKMNCMAASSNAFRFLPGRGIQDNILSCNQNKLSFDNLLEVNNVVCSSALIHNSVFKVVKGFPEDEELMAIEDYALWLRVASQTDFAFIEEPLLTYCDNPPNSIRSKGLDGLTQRKIVLQNFISWGEEQGICNELLTKAREKYNALLFEKKKKSYFTHDSTFVSRLKSLLFPKKKIAVAFSEVLYFNCSDYVLTDRNCLDIVTVAFNNEKVIEQQHRLLNKYLKPPFYYTVADNSTDPDKQKKIMKLCESNDIAYIRLPENPYSSESPSLSHGIALNWIYDNYVYKRKADYFGFLDHDIFPIHPTNVIEQLQKSNIFGLLQERSNKWYLWAGLCFFKYAYVKNKKLNFMPGDGLDTGGSNWESIYSKLNKNELVSLKHEYGQLREGKEPQSDLYEKIGDWLHTFNASNWKKIQYKDDLVDDLLNKF